MNTSDREIVTTRVFNYPASTIFKAWSDPVLLAKWWGPNGFTNTFHKFEFKPDGIWEFTMKGPDGTDFPNKNVFIEMVEPEKIIFRHLSPTHGFLVTITFEKLDAKTKLIFRMLFDSIEEFTKVKTFIVEANEQNFDRLEAVLVLAAMS